MTMLKINGDVSREDQHLKALFEAALTGSVTTINNIVRQDPLVLHRVSLSNLSETPLHVSCLVGHLDFTIALLQQCPQMASERDSLQRLPIHLASAKGHVEILKALLSYGDSYKDVCLARDEEGRIPLHLAVIRGRVDSVRVLVTAYYESAYELLDGDNVFHLCVKYNRFDALKLIVEIVDDDVLLTRGNQDGNTILHLAAMLKKVEVTKYLLTLSEVKARVNALNNKELTALDLLEQMPLVDLKTIQIRDVLTISGAKRAAELNSNSNNLPIPTPNSAQVSTKSSSKSKAKSWFKKCMKFIEYDRQEIRGALMIVATVIATMSYQTTINPPGGVWQQNSVDSNTGFGCSATDICEAGTSVLGHAYPKEYRLYLIWNTTSFFGSLLVIALVVSGFPLKNKFCVWLLAQALTVTLAASSFSYIFGMALVAPFKMRVEMSKFGLKMYFGWAGLHFVATIFEIVRFLVWTMKRLRKRWRKFKNKRKTSRISPDS